ncbi:MAG: PmoA family protein [Pirellulales bacterium]|nr:PmoA family protein [Pirellulales bacterium]
MMRFVCVGTLAALAFGTVSSAAEFSWQTDSPAGTADLQYGEQTVLRYMFAYDPSTDQSRHDTYKVFHHVFGPQSGTRITKGPGGKYTHHRGMFVGWNRTGFQDKSLDFWHCKNGAHLRHVRFIDQSADAEKGSMTAEIHWNDAQGKPVIVERRTVVVRREPATNGWQIDWSTRLESKRGEITLAGDRQHAGFQFRADQPVAETNGSTYLRPKSFPQNPQAIQVGDKGDPPPHVNLNWFANTYQLDGRRYTVEYFDNPNLPKPSLFSERPYGRFGTYFKTKLSQEQPLEMRYRLIVSEGQSPEVDEIQTRYDAFVADLSR